MNVARGFSRTWQGNLRLSASFSHLKVTILVGCPIRENPRSEHVVPASIPGVLNRAGRRGRRRPLRHRSPLPSRRRRSLYGLARHELVHGSRDADYAAAPAPVRRWRRSGPEGLHGGQYCLLQRSWRIHRLLLELVQFLSPDNVADHRFRVVLRVAMPILMVVAGIRLWKGAAGAQRLEEASVSVGNSARAA